MLNRHLTTTTTPLPRSATITDQLRESCEYDPQEDSSVDCLIGYKDALEDTVDFAEHTLNELLHEAVKTARADYAKWERLACGQDTEEAEASGVLDGQVAGLQAALHALRGDGTAARADLDLYIEEDE